MSATNSIDPRATAPPDDRFHRWKAQIHQRLVTSLNPSVLNSVSEEDMRRQVRQVAEELCQRSPDLLSRADRERLITEVLAETFGLGPLEKLMSDQTITDILINGHKAVYVERNGRLQPTDVSFVDDRHVVHIVQRMVARAGRRVDETNPMVDSRLPDGSRINAIIPPAALDGPLVSIRRFGGRPLLATDLLAGKSATKEMLDFLAACVQARLSVVISGGTGGGKTTLMNALSAFIPSDERIVTIEDAAELQLQQRHVGRLETRPANIEGVGEITTRDLVRNALRMRPDRIIIGECRGPEALDMLQAMNTGHEGSMTTLHANDTRDALNRLEMMVGMAGFEIPMWVIRRQIAAAVHIIVQVGRLVGGARKITRISEVTGVEGENIAMHDLFSFTQTGVDAHRTAQGYFGAHGIRPKCLDRLAVYGKSFAPEFFGRRMLGVVG